MKCFYSYILLKVTTAMVGVVWRHNYHLMTQANLVGIGPGVSEEKIFQNSQDGWWMLGQGNWLTWLGWQLWNICVTNDHGYVPLVVNTSRSFPHSWLITGFVTRLTWRMPLVEQELLPFRSTWVHPRFLVGFMLLYL